MSTISKEAREAAITFKNWLPTVTLPWEIDRLANIIQLVLDAQKSESEKVHETLADFDADCGESPTLDRANKAAQTVRIFEHGVRELCIELGFDPSDGEEPVEWVLECAKRKVQEALATITELRARAESAERERNYFKLILERFTNDCPCDNDGQGCPCGRLSGEALSLIEAAQPPQQGDKAP